VEDQFPELRRLREQHDWDAEMRVPFASAWGDGGKEYLAGALMAACFRKGEYTVVQKDVLTVLFATSMQLLAAQARHVFWDMIESREIETISGENSASDMLISPSPSLVEKYLAASRASFVSHRKGWLAELESEPLDEQ
jgi:hypothetical protein